MNQEKEGKDNLKLNKYEEYNHLLNLINRICELLY